MVPGGLVERMVTMSSVWSIRRSTADKKLAGVCGGVARHWNVDPILVRVGWALLALSGGVGVVLYVAAWLLVPADGSTTSTMDDLTKGQTSSWPRDAWVAIVAVACLVTFVAFSSTTTVSFWPAVVLALIWYFGYYKSRSNRSGGPTQSPPSELSSTQQLQRPPQGSPGAPPPAESFRYPGPTTPFTEAAEAWRQRVEDMRQQAGPSSTPPQQTGPGRPATPTPAPAPTAAPAAAGWQGYPYGSDPSPVQDPITPEVAARADFLAAADPVGLYTEVAPAKAAAAPSRRTQAQSLSARRLRLVAVVVVGLVLLGLGIADALGAPITPVIYTSAALLVVGLTLVAATWLGRARGILPIGLVLLLVVAGLSVAKPVGQFVHEFSYASVSELPSQPLVVDHGVVSVDLRNIDVTSDVTFAADLGAGAIEIEVPANTNLVLDYSVGTGAVMDNNTTVASGDNLHGTAPLQQSRGDEPTLTLDIDVNHGVVAVKR